MLAFVHLQSKPKTVGMSVGSEATRKYILAKEEITHCFAERFTLDQDIENQKFLYSVLIPS